MNIITLYLIIILNITCSIICSNFPQILHVGLFAIIASFAMAFRRVDALAFSTSRSDLYEEMWMMETQDRNSF